MQSPHPLTPGQIEELRSLAHTGRDHLNAISQDTDEMDAYVVGGAVRDALLGYTASDLDFVVVGETPTSMRDRGFQAIEASSFPIFHDDNHEEWALARTESSTGPGYKAFEYDTSSVTLAKDLERRDLRLNAMAVGIGPDTPAQPASIDSDSVIDIPETDTSLIDPFDGAIDARTGQLRHVSDAFADDPLRVLRVARYRARFEHPAPAFRADDDGDIEDALQPFNVSESTADMMRQVAPDLNRMSRDRIGAEVTKAMRQARQPRAFWDTLRETGALAVVAPLLDRASIVPAGIRDYHGEGDTYEHTMLVVERMHQLCEEQDITGTARVRRLLMAVAHDLGKVIIADDKGGLWSDDPPTRFGNHDERGIEPAERLGKRLGLDPHYTDAMRDAAELHMSVFDLPRWDIDRLLEFVKTHDAETATPYHAQTEELLDLLHSDHEGRFQTLEAISDDVAVTQYDDSDAPEDDLARPLLDREEYELAIEAARTARRRVDGIDVLRENLCDDHDPAALDDGDIAPTLRSCDVCPSPGPWVGEDIHEKRVDIVAEQLATE